MLCLDRSLPVSAQKIEDGGRGQGERGRGRGKGEGGRAQDILEIQDTRFEGLIEAEQTLYVVFLLSWSIFILN